jgi:nucleotide-binding universal stress UspA family protein
MRNVIIPVDFSDTSLNAARYGANFLKGQYDASIVLHHVYEKESQAKAANDQLLKLKEELTAIGFVKITVIAEEGDDFIDELEKLARHHQADLIIMGITGRSALGQTFIGSNTLKMVNRKFCPVLIVPESAQFHAVKNVLLASDFKDTRANTPSAPIKKVLEAFRPQLHVVNVDTRHYVALTDEIQHEKSQLIEMFKEYNPEFYFLGLYDVDEAINQFAHDKNIDFIILIHKEQSLMSKMFRTSHTKRLAYQSSLPILALHE